MGFTCDLACDIPFTFGLAFGWLIEASDAERFHFCNLKDESTCETGDWIEDSSERLWNQKGEGKRSVLRCASAFMSIVSAIAVGPAIAGMECDGRRPGGGVGLSH